jgi:hypothetical protein
MDPKITPEALTPDFYGGYKFGVQQATENFRLLSPQLVLYHITYLHRGLTAISFTRNQLFPALIDLSSLCPGHPKDLHIITGSILHLPFERLQSTQA